MRSTQDETEIYRSKDEEEYRSVIAFLDKAAVPRRIWITEEPPVFGYTIMDPRKMARGETSLRRIYHICVSRSDIMSANIAVRKGVEAVHPGTSLTRRPPLDVI